MEISDIKYPELNRTAMLYPSPGVILGNELYWEQKWDGSNIRFYLDTNDDLVIGSRNLPVASEDIVKGVNAIPGLVDNVKELLLDARTWHSSYILFGELLLKGKSPTRITTYDENKFIAFDLWTMKTEQFVPYTILYQQCYHSNIECVDVQKITRHIEIEEFYRYRDEMLEANKDIEGFVIKSYNSSFNNGMLSVKEKHDTIKLDKIPRDIKDGKPRLPVLTDSEIYGAVDKVIADIGIDQFKQIKIAMPIVVQYVNEEAKKHCMSSPRNVFKYYKDKMEDL